MTSIKCYRNLFTLSLTIMACISCEKVIEVDVKNAEPQLVVQGNIHTSSGPYLVYLNLSVGNDETNNFPVVQGASVHITDNIGGSEKLTESLPGVYSCQNLKGEPGNTYTLKINTNNKEYTAVSYLNKPVPLDSFLLEPIKSQNSNIINGYRVICKFTDPAGAGNYYRLVFTSDNPLAITGRNDRVISDKYLDGQQVSVRIRTNLKSKDSVFVQLQSIDKVTYDFYNTLPNALGGVGAVQFLASLPANPTNNISNGGLGYFTAYGLTKEKKKVP